MKKIFIGLTGLILFILSLSLLIKTIRADGSLLAYWRFDETTAGSTVVDSTGNGYDGTPHNSPSPSTDVPSTITFSDPRSLQFDGTQWVSIPDNSAFAMTSATFSVWVKFTDTSQGDMNMIAKRSSDGSQVQWQFGYNGGGNQFKVSLANGGNSCCTDFDWSPSPALTENVWYNIAVTIDGTNHILTWYQNGVSKTTQNITGHNLGTEIPGTDLTLGASYNGTGEKLYGLLDDVRIYNVALSGTDVADIASGDSGPGVPTPTPTSTPTPTPTTTPTPGGSNTNSGSSSSSSTSTSCTNAQPGTPNLFQVTTSLTTASLYFVPTSGATEYVVSYGTNTSADQYNATINTTETSGAISYTVNSLQSNTRYFFKVEAKNGCMPSNWSQILSQATIGNKTVTNNSSLTTFHTSSPQGTISVVKQNQVATQSTNPIQQGYDLTVSVQSNGQPVSGATVELHSIPMQTVTDKNGIARFSNVAKGNHTILLSYNNYSGQEKVAVNGDKKDVAINLTIQLNSYTNWMFIGGIILIVFLLLIIAVLLFFLKKRNRGDKD